MITKIFDFQNPSEYNVPSEIEINNGGVLLLQNNIGQEFILDFLSDAGMDYDPALINFPGTDARQIDQTPTNSVLGATYVTDYDLNWIKPNVLPDLVGNPIGTPTVSGGRLNCTGGLNTSVYYESDAIGNIGSQGTIKITFIPGYSGTPSNNTNIKEISNGINSENKIVLFHGSTGTIRLSVNDSTGSVVHSAYSFPTIWSPIAGTEYEIELNINATSGLIEPFFQGVSIGTTPLTPFTRTNAANRLYIGAGTTYFVSDAEYDNVTLFNTVQHTANYIPGYTLPENIYLETVITTPELEYTGAGTLISFDLLTALLFGLIKLSLQIGRSGNYLYWDGANWSISDGSYIQSTDLVTFNTNIASLPISGEVYGQYKIHYPNSNDIAYISQLTSTLTAQSYPITNPRFNIIEEFTLEELLDLLYTINITGLDDVKLILSKNGVLYYHDGIIWTISNGTYAQSNTITEIQDNKSTFTTENVTTKIYIFLHSEDGTTTPKITALTIVYDFFGNKDIVSTPVVWGYQLMPNGLPDLTQITIKLNQPSALYKDTIQVTGDLLTVYPRSTGYWEINLIENENMETDAHYIFKLEGKIYKRKIPDVEEIEFNNLTVV